MCLTWFLPYADGFVLPRARARPCGAGLRASAGSAERAARDDGQRGPFRGAQEVLSLCTDMY